MPICHVLDKNIFVVHGGVPKPDPISNKPYLLSQMDKLETSRFDTAILENNPAEQDKLWHQFLWSYDRLPYFAEFLEANGFKTAICSHSAPMFHFTWTF